MTRTQTENIKLGPTLEAHFTGQSGHVQVQARRPGGPSYKTFISPLIFRQSKLERLSLTKHFNRSLTFAGKAKTYVAIKKI
jgi:hypothetical protein